MWNRYLRSYYDLVAPNYVGDLEPTFQSLAQGLVDMAPLRVDSRVIDLGAGSGAVSRLASTSSAIVVSADISHQMLVANHDWGSAMPVQCDIQMQPFRDDSLDIALASFSLNATDARKCLYEVRRTLVPGGWLIAQEWGREDKLSEVVFETLTEYSVEEPSPELAKLRDMVATPIPWDDIESVDDIKNLLTSCEYQVNSFSVIVVPVYFSSARDFARFKLAWPSRRMEVAEMPSEIRRIFYNELVEHIVEFAEPDGSVIWRPEVVRFRAAKPS